MTEDRVSFPVAKLLYSDKIKCYGLQSNPKLVMVYDLEGKLWHVDDIPTNRCYTAPTQALACKWLREKKGIHITHDRNPKEKNVFEYFYIIKTGDGFNTEPIFSGDFDTPQEAIEAALIYSLEKLVK